MRRTHSVCVIGLFLLCAGCGDGLELSGDINSAVAEVRAEPGWVEVLTVVPGAAIAAHFNPVDGAIYYGGRSDDPAVRGLWRVAPDGTVEKVGGTTYVGGVAVNPANGDVFYGDDFSGRIFRSEGGVAPPASWAFGFHRGDDDPVGMAIAPADHNSGIVAPGEIVVVDRGSGGPDEVWVFSSDTPEGERPIHVDNGTLVNGVDVAITQDSIYVADQDAGIIYRLLADQSLEVVPSPPLSPAGLAVDPVTQDLFVMDLDSASVLRFNPLTGETSVVLSELQVNTGNWASVDVSEDGTRLVVTERETPERGTIRVFEFAPNNPPVAVCEDVVVEIGGESCDGTASVGAGSFDPDGDVIDVELSDAGPYPVGDTTVTVTVTDSAGETDSCTAVVSVVQTGQAWIAQNAAYERAGHRKKQAGGLSAFGFFGGGKAVFDVESVVFEAAADDSTARMSGTVRVRRDGAFGLHNGELWTVDLLFEQAPEHVRPRGVPRNSEAAADWRFFRLSPESRMSRADGTSTTKLLSWPKFVPFAFQLGDGANRRNQNFGLSGSFFYAKPWRRRLYRVGPAAVSVDLVPVCAADDEGL